MMRIRLFSDLHHLVYPLVQPPLSILNCGRFNGTILGDRRRVEGDRKPRACWTLPHSVPATCEASGKITTTNPQWGGRADLRIGGRSSDLLIGNQIPTAQSQQIKSFQDPATTVLPVGTSGLSKQPWCGSSLLNCWNRPTRRRRTATPPWRERSRRLRLSHALAPRPSEPFRR